MTNAFLAICATLNHRRNPVGAILRDELPSQAFSSTNVLIRRPSGNALQPTVQSATLRGVRMITHRRQPFWALSEVAGGG
jgi:hypothetical protein